MTFNPSSITNVITPSKLQKALFRWSRKLMRNFLNDAKCLHPIDDPIFISSSEATFLLYLISDARIFKLTRKFCINWRENFASIEAKKTKMQTQKSTFSPKLNVAQLWLEYLSKFRKISANLNIDEIIHLKCKTLNQ